MRTWLQINDRERIGQGRTLLADKFIIESLAHVPVSDVQGYSKKNFGVIISSLYAEVLSSRSGRGNK